MDLSKFYVEDKEKQKKQMKEIETHKAEFLKFKGLIEKKMDKTIADGNYFMERCGALKAQNDDLKKQLASSTLICPY